MLTFLAGLKFSVANMGIYSRYVKLNFLPLIFWRCLLDDSTLIFLWDHKFGWVTIRILTLVVCLNVVINILVNFFRLLWKLLNLIQLSVALHVSGYPFLIITVYFFKTRIIRWSEILWLCLEKLVLLSLCIRYFHVSRTVCVD